MRHDLPRLVRSFFLSLGGEGVQSGFHFILNLILIRLLAPYEFGVFAIAFVLGGIGLSYGNALVTVPAVVQMARMKSRKAVDFLDVAFGSIAMLYASVIGILVALGLFLTLGHDVEAVMGGAFVGLWMLRNHVRTSLFARRLMRAATLADVSYTASGIVFVAAALWLDREGERVTSVLGALAGAHLVAIGIAMRALPRVRLSLRASVWRRYRKLRSDVAWSLFGTTTWNVQSQGLAFLTAALAGPAAYAPVAAGFVLFNPVRQGVIAFINVFRADFVSALGEGNYRRIRVTVAAFCALILASCAAAGLAIYLAWPNLDAHIFTGKFDHASLPLIVTLCGLTAAIYLTYSVPLTLVQAAGQFRPVALATTCGAVVGLCSVTVLLHTTTVAWSVLGVLAGEAVCGVYLSIAAWRILRRHTAPAWQGAGAVAGART